MKAKLILLLAVIVLLALAAYLYEMASSAKQIEARLEDIKVVGIGLKGIKLDISILVENPTGYHYSIDEIRYRIYVEEIEVGRGISRDIDLPPKSTSVQHAEVDLNYSSLGRAFLELISKGSVGVKVNGTAVMRILMVPVEVPFSEVKNISFGS